MMRLWAMMAWLCNSVGLALAVVAPLLVPDEAFADTGACTSSCQSSCAPGDMTCLANCGATCCLPGCIGSSDPNCMTTCCAAVCNNDPTCIQNCAQPYPPCGNGNAECAGVEGQFDCEFLHPSCYLSQSTTR